MTNCWKVNPKDRPTFLKILRDLRVMLADNEVIKLSCIGGVYTSMYSLNTLKLLPICKIRVVYRVTRM